jgi:hypothetical protein
MDRNPGKSPGHGRRSGTPIEKRVLARDHLKSGNDRMIHPRYPQSLKHQPDRTETTEGRVTLDEKFGEAQQYRLWRGGAW